jgi:hypothetical protein
MSSPNKRPNVRHLPWPENGVAGLQPETFGPDLNDVFSLYSVEPLIFLVVQMARRSTLLPIRMLHDQVTAAAVLG